MGRLTPLLNDLGQCRHRAHAHVHRTHHEVMSVPVIEPVSPVALDALFLMVPLLSQLANGPLREHRQIPVDEPRMLARQLHFPVKTQVVADKNLRTGNDAGRKGFVMAVTQAQHPGVVPCPRVVGHLDEPEVAVALVTESMCLAHDTEVGLEQRTLHLFHKPQVRNRSPRSCARRRFNFGNGGTLNGVRTTMQNKVTRFHDVETTKAVSPIGESRPFV
jgi:hypothetical protein